jgi:hypothetical protein
MDERDEAAGGSEAAAKPVPIGLVRLRQHFVEPVQDRAKEIAAAGVIAGLAAVMGADDEAPPNDGGDGPSPRSRRGRWAALGVIAVLAAVFVVEGFLR